MSQTITVISGPEAGGMTGKPLKLIVLNILNGANEVNVAIDYRAYGLGVVLLYGHVLRDAYTNNFQTDNLSGGTVTHVWGATDVANALVWAIGY